MARNKGEQSGLGYDPRSPRDIGKIIEKTANVEGLELSSQDVIDIVDIGNKINKLEEAKKIGKKSDEKEIERLKRELAGYFSKEK